jgi:hypothetical protein
MATPATSVMVGFVVENMWVRERSMTGSKWPVWTRQLKETRIDA